MTEKPKPTASPNYPASFYSRLFDVSERRIQQLAKDGIIPRAARGKYPLIGTIQGYVKFLQERAANSAFDGNDGDLQSERRRLTRAQADAQELKNAVAERKVVPVEFAVYTLSGVGAKTASILDTLPLTLKRRHPDLEARHIDSITREVTRARNEAAQLSDHLPELLNDYYRLLEHTE